MTALLCPLCSQPRFANLESLRLSLVNVATQNIACPICNDVLVGLDKLTIHLFGHTLAHQQQQEQQEQEASLLDVVRTDNSFGLYVDPPPPPEPSKPIDDVSDFNVAEFITPDIIPFQPVEPKPESTVNMEDLTYLTSWETPPRLKNEDAKSETTELSEYMSDLLNKKLPILNFVFTMDETESKKQPEEEAIVEEIKQDVEAPPTFDCHLCPKTFKMKGSLMVHFRVAHFGSPDTQGGQVGPASPEERSFKCLQCSKGFKKEQHLAQHVKTHEGKHWQCETCNKHFTTKYFLKKHQRLHTGEMPYCCPTCNKTFTFQQSYHKHILYHSDDKPHECNECGRAFKELSTLHNHLRIHSGEKPFSCETCGKCFRQRVSYIVHQRIHTGVLPYQCTACKKKFRYKVSQRSHKCAAQPPGVVVRQPGDLIQRILEHRNAILQTTE